MGTSSKVRLFAFMHRQFKVESRWRLKTINRSKLESFSITELEYANVAITYVTLATYEYSINDVIASESVSELVVNGILTRK